MPHDYYRDSSGADMTSVKVAVKIDPAIAADLRLYARFHHLTPSSIISAEMARVLAWDDIGDYYLRAVISRDKSFQLWKKNRGASTVPATPRKATKAAKKPIPIAGQR
jgi:hypothetical protein